MEKQQTLLRDLIRKSNRIVFFGGAGVSTASGIPDFRSAHGLYNGSEGHKYEEMLSSAYFHRRPDDFWHFYRDVMLYPNAKPNQAHFALSKLEAEGKLSAVVTQNIDGLHQMAGSTRVIELHGTVLDNICVRCGKHYHLSEVLKTEGTPHCSCGGFLKPKVVLYGESLCDKDIDCAIEEIENCDLLLVGGTSLTVQPAASLIQYRRKSAPLVILNSDATPYDEQADVMIREPIEEALWQAVTY